MAKYKGLYWCNDCSYLTQKKVRKDFAKCDKCGADVDTIGFIEDTDEDDAVGEKE